MHTRDDVETIKFDHTDPALAPRLFDVLTDLQQRFPVAWNDTGEGFWLLSKYADTAPAANDWEHFTVTDGITIPETGKSVKLPLSEMDPPEHAHFRRFALPHFTANALEPRRAELAAIVADSFAGIVAEGGGDLVTRVTRQLPVRAICLILGIDAEWQIVSRLAENFLSTTSETTDRSRAVRAGAELETFLQTQIDARRGRPVADLLGHFIHAEVLGQPLSDDQILGLCVVMIVAGHGTTTDGIGTLIHRVITEPGLRERLLADRSLASRVVEESLRLDPPVWNMARTVAEPTEVRGFRLNPGDKVMLAYGAANRDPDKYADPTSFDPDRAGLSQHQSFGSGRHRCIGEALARLELELSLEFVLDHLPDLELDGDVVWRLSMNGHGLDRIPVRRGLPA